MFSTAYIYQNLPDGSSALVREDGSVWHANKNKKRSSFKTSIAYQD